MSAQGPLVLSFWVLGIEISCLKYALWEPPIYLLIRHTEIISALVCMVTVDIGSDLCISQLFLPVNAKLSITKAFSPSF